MKDLKTFLLALLMTVGFTACRTGIHVIVASDDNNTNIKLEYWGNVVLNSNETAIKSISPKGYIQYNKNDDKLYIAPAGDGNITYELNGDKSQTLSPKGHQLLAEVVQKIAQIQSEGH